MYLINTRKKDYFLLTPEEFSSVFNGFSFVVASTGAKQGCTVSDTNEIMLRYRELYQLLASGKRCVWEEDYPLLGFMTGVTAHPENCIYTKKVKVSWFPISKSPASNSGYTALCHSAKHSFPKDGWYRSFRNMLSGSK